MKEQGIVGRAELKLAEAAEAFSYDFRRKVVLDIGSSTGGFTEYALRRGAKKVIAIEKGTRQMKAPLRYNPRVDLYEKTDFLELGKAYSQGNETKKQGENEVELVTPLQVASLGSTSVLAELDKRFDVGILKQVDTVLADVSFVSLTKILAQAKKLVNRKADYLVMLKPQFEARSDQLVNGVVKNEKMRREIMQNFERWLMKNGFIVLKKRDNELVGKRGGNRERFYLLRMAK